MPNLAPQVLEALAVIRNAVRTSKGQDLSALYQILLSLSLYAICETIPGQTENAPVVQIGKLSHSIAESGTVAGRVQDRWISPRECACRLDISLRTLRRRARRHPYTSFCIPLDHGFKVSELGLDQHMQRERQRAMR